jgi:hypothetical protein
MLFINIYLKKSIQKSITTINVQEFKKIIDVIILRIRNDLILKKKVKAKNNIFAI